jgi:hypothetical protein
VKSWKGPLVRENQRIIPKDFIRLLEMVLDVPAQLAQHLFLYPAAEANSGIVLWGLQVVSAADGGNPRRIKVKAGACLVPMAAPNLTGQDTNDGALDSGGLRLIVLPNDTFLDLDAAPAPRTDTIELDASQIDETLESREFRALGAGGANVILNNVATYRRPVGIATVRKGVNGVAFANACLLAKVPINGDGSMGAPAPLQTYMWPATSGGVGNDNAGIGLPYSRGPRRLLDWIRKRVDSVISLAPTGGLANAVKVAAGGPDIAFTDDVVDWVTRAVKGVATWRAGRLRVGGQDAADGDADATLYRNDDDGLALNAATAIRACCVVTPTYAADDYAAATYVGQNVTGVTRVGVGHYIVTIRDEAGASVFGDLNDSSRWEVKGFPVPFATDTTAGLSALKITPAKVVTPSGFTGNDLDVRLYAWHDATQAFDLVDFPFGINVRGPFYAGLDPSPVS